MGTCSDSGCVRDAVKRGMCGTHYQTWRAQTPPENRVPPTAEERFHSRVRQGAPDECWPWTGGCSDTGYGGLYVAGRRVGAHRFAFMLAYGFTPDQVDHTCHNNSGCAGGRTCAHRRCCNPAHLESTDSLTNSLRGESLAARHARKTHCVNRHEFTAENTYLYKYRSNRTRRMCKQCGRDRQRAKSTNRKAA